MATAPASPTGHRFAVMTLDNHGASAWIATALSLTYCFLVFAARFIVKRGLYGIDDVILSVAHVLALGQWIAIFVSLSDGLGKALTLLNPKQESRISQSFYASRILLYVVLGLSKCGILLFLRQLFSDDMKKAWRVCNITISVVLTWAIAAALTVSVGCSPDKVLLEQRNNHCRNNVIRLKIVTAFDVVTECMIVALPAYLIWNINMPFNRKFRVLLAFAFRLPVTAFSVAYLVSYSAFLDSSKKGIAISPLIVWQEILMSYSLMSTTIPCLKGFIEQFTTGGMGYTTDLTTGNGAWHQMGSIKSKTPAQESAPPSRSLVLRPEPVEYSAYAEHSQEGPHESASITTESSRHMMIRKTVSLNVRRK